MAQRGLKEEKRRLTIEQDDHMELTARYDRRTDFLTAGAIESAGGIRWGTKR